MADESGNQTIKVGTGGATGGALDAGTDHEQTNRKPSSGVRHPDKKEAKDYGAGEPENFTGAATPSGAGIGTGRGEQTGLGATRSENDPNERGAAVAGVVTKTERKKEGEKGK
jgi:hypothetical protein